MSKIVAEYGNESGGLIVYDKEPALPVPGGRCYGVGPDGEPILLRRDQRMVTDLAYLARFGGRR